MENHFYNVPGYHYENHPSSKMDQTAWYHQNRKPGAGVPLRLPLSDVTGSTF